MKRIFPLVCCLIVVVSFLAVTYTIAPGGQNMPESSPVEMIAVLNPAVANGMADRSPLAPRPDTLDGKTIYMIAVNWGGPQAALNVFEEMQSWFDRNMPGVQIVIRLKKGGYDADDPDLWKEISERKAAGAILGVSG
jgi:hypothetical protein